MGERQGERNRERRPREHGQGGEKESHLPTAADVVPV